MKELGIHMSRGNESLAKIEKCVSFFRKYWGLITAFSICVSIIALFTCSLIFDKKIELQIMNNWVGIILGLVATIMSIISLFLSFYNLEREREEGRENRELFFNFKTILDDLRKEQSGMKNTLTEQLEETRTLNQNLTSSKSAIVIENDPNGIGSKEKMNTDLSNILRKLNGEVNEHE